jgi:hypothetical protein
MVTLTPPHPGTLMALPAPDDDSPRPAETPCTSNGGQLEGAAGDGGVVADERADHDAKVRRRMARGTRNRKAGPELDDPDGQGSVGDGAVPVGKRRKSPFPPPTDTSETLFSENLGLARKVAWSWARRTGMPYDDIEQIAMMGLLRGCRKYDATKINPGSGKSYALSTYVVPYAHGELLHWYRDNPYAISFPPKWREQYGKVHRMLGQSAPLEDISAATGLSVEELGEMVERMVTPAELNCEVVGSHDISAELDLATPLGELVDLAYDDLAPADRALLEAWILKPKGPFPHGPMQQFDRRLDRVLSGRRLTELRQLTLISIPEVKALQQRQTARRQRRQHQDNGQIDLFA